MEIDRTLCETCVFQEYYPTQKPCLTCLGGSPLRVTGDRYLKYIPTNADKIRHMNDEELASFLMHPRSMCPQWDCDTCPEDNWCESCVLAWLKKECEDGEEE